MGGPQITCLSPTTPQNVSISSLFHHELCILLGAQCFYPGALWDCACRQLLGKKRQSQEEQPNVALSSRLTCCSLALSSLRNCAVQGLEKMGHDRPSSVSTRETEPNVTTADLSANGETPFTNGRLPSYSFSTTRLPTKDQFDAYRNVFSVFGDPSLPEDTTPACGFSAERTGYDVGALSVVMSKCDAYSFTKSVRQASANILDHWVLVLRRTGWADIDFGNNVQHLALEGRHHDGPVTHHGHTFRDRQPLH